MHFTPTKKIMGLNKGLKRGMSSLITQIRTEEIGLQQHFLQQEGSQDTRKAHAGDIAWAIRLLTEHLTTTCRGYYRQRRAITEPEEMKRGGRIITYKERKNDPLLARAVFPPSDCCRAKTAALSRRRWPLFRRCIRTLAAIQCPKT